MSKSINYSIALRPSDPSKENSPKKAYAVSQYKDVMSLDEFAAHIAEHGSVFDEATITGVLIKAVRCMREQLLAGNKVRLGDLGAFSVSLQSKGAETAKEFTSELITAVNVNWDPGQKFQNLIAEASFNPVTSRAVQAASLKAEKEGAKTVDIEAAKAKNKSNASEGSASGSDDDPENTTPVVTPPSGSDDDDEGSPNGGD